MCVTFLFCVCLFLLSICLSDNIGTVESTNHTTEHNIVDNTSTVDNNKIYVMIAAFILNFFAIFSNPGVKFACFYQVMHESTLAMHAVFCNYTHPS